MFVHVYINYIVSGPEKKRNYGQTQVYVIRWRPSQCSVDPIEEIILDEYHYDTNHVIGKVCVLFEIIIIVIIENMYQYGIIIIPLQLSKLSGVPAEYIFCKKVSH